METLKLFLKVTEEEVGLFTTADRCLAGYNQLIPGVKWFNLNESGYETYIETSVVLFHKIGYGSGREHPVKVSDFEGGLYHSWRRRRGRRTVSCVR